MFNMPENSVHPIAGTRTRMLTTGDAAAYLGLSVSYLNKMRISGGGPVFLKLRASGSISKLPPSCASAPAEDGVVY